MSSSIYRRILNSKVYIILKRYLVLLLRTIFESIISILFVQLPTFCNYTIRLGKTNGKSEKQKRVRAKLVDDEDSTSPYRDIQVIDKLNTKIEKNVETLADIPDLCAKRHRNKETMGVREILNIEDEKQANGKVFKKFIFGEYKFTTFGEACVRIDSIGRALLSIGAKSDKKILLFSETRPEWLLTAFAAFRHKLTLVTLLPTLDEEGIKHGINESKVKIVITSQQLVNKLEKILNETENVRYIIYFPDHHIKSQETKVPKDKNNVQFISLDDFQEQGNNAFIDEQTLNERPKKEDIAVIMYTSGSTGPPKGTLISHENIIAAMTGQKERVFPILDVDNDVYVSYLPLGHILGLCCEILVFYLGLKNGYSSPLTLTDQSTAVKRGQKGDLQVLRPHLMACVPTILDRIYTAVNGKTKESNFFKRQLFNLMYTIKVKRLESGLRSPILDRLIFSRFNKMVLGGRLKAMLSGGAILSEDTQRFAEVVLCVKVFQGYGLTETCAAGTIVDQYDITVGRAGYPLVSCEIRLINWDEGQYKTTDKPNPRGEILIGGKIVAQGYFGEAEKENENFKEIDGTRYFYTGDIGEVFPDGTLKIFDRKKDVVKIRGGKYVSLAKVEMAINKLSSIDNSCVCASSSNEFTVALICPNSKEMEKFAEKHFNEKDWKKLVDDEEFNDEIYKKVHETCKKNSIKEFEIPQRIKIVTDSWSPESGLVNDALKLKRKAIQQKYEDDIQQLYEHKLEQDPAKKNEATSNKNHSKEKSDDDKKKDQ